MHCSQIQPVNFPILFFLVSIPLAAYLRDLPQTWSGLVCLFALLSSRKDAQDASGFVPFPVAIVAGYDSCVSVSW
ncbi:hypothetical protein J3E69DRAFT_238736 [Trichoderma sp. SZMC 28015]